MITIRKNVPQFIREDIEGSLGKAINFMKGKYPDVDFDVDFIFQYSSSRSRYFRNNNKDSKYTKPTATICTRSLLMLYDMKSLNIVRNTLDTDNHIQIECSIVHELTHHVQYEKGLAIGELLTTSNELEYLKNNYFEVWDYLMVE